MTEVVSMVKQQTDKKQKQGDSDVSAKYLRE